jgi:1-acyl-sn-glycerol-3-phosphate acyltransferase
MLILKVLRAVLSAFLYLLYLIFTIAVFIPTVIIRLLSGSQRFVLWVSRIWLYLCLRLVFWVRPYIYGLENIEPGKTYLVMSNHQSFMDIPLLGGCLPVGFSWLAKKSLFKIPIIGQSMSLAGFIPIERESKRKSQESIKQVADYLRAGRSILIFPEGTRSYRDELLPFKRGGVSILAQVNVPILPVTICGSYKVLDPGSLIIHFFRKIYVKIDAPLTVQGTLDKQGQLELLNQVKGRMEQNIKELTQIDGN